MMKQQTNCILRSVAGVLTVLTLLLSLSPMAVAVNDGGDPAPIRTAYVSETEKEVSYVDPALTYVDGAAGNEKITFATYERAALAGVNSLFIRVGESTENAETLPVYLINDYMIPQDLTYGNMPTLGYLDYVGELDLASGKLDISGLTYAGDYVTFVFTAGYRENFNGYPTSYGLLNKLQYDRTTKQLKNEAALLSDVSGKIYSVGNPWQVVDVNGAGRYGFIQKPNLNNGSFTDPVSSSNSNVSAAGTVEGDNCLAISTSGRHVKLFNLVKLSDLDGGDLGRSFFIKCQVLTSAANTGMIVGVRSTGTDQISNTVSLTENTWNDVGCKIDVTQEAIDKQIGLVRFSIGSGTSPIYIDNIVVTRTDVAASLFAAPPTEVEPSIDGAQVSLGESLTIKIYTTLPEDKLDAKLKVERNGEIAVLAGSATNKGNVYIYEDLNPQCMGDALNMTLFRDTDGDNVVDEGETLAAYNNYSAKAYCMDMLEYSAAFLGMTKTRKAMLDTLICDLLVYGGAAQSYVKYHSDDLVSEGIIGSEFVKPSAQKTLLTTDAANASFAAATVRFANTNSLVFKVRSKDIEKTTLTIGNKTYTATEADKDAENDYYSFTTDALYAAEFGDMLTIELRYEGALAQTLTYGMNCYIANMADKEGAMGALARATYNYGLAASYYAKSSEITLETIPLDKSLDEGDVTLGFYGKGGSLGLTLETDDALAVHLDGILLNVSAKAGANTLTLNIPEGYHTLRIAGKTTLESVSIPGFETVLGKPKSDMLIVKLLEANADGYSAGATEAYRSFHVYTPTSDPSGRYYVRYQFTYEYNDTRNNYKVNQCTNVSNYRIKTSQLVSMDYTGGEILNETVICELLGNGELSFAVKDKNDNGEANPDFVGGFHGDERLKSAVLTKDGTTVDLCAEGGETVFACDTLVFEQTTKIYRNSTSSTESVGTEMADHVQTFTLEASGITNSREVTWLGEFNLVQCYMQMFPMLREDGDDRVADSFTLYKESGEVAKETVTVVGSEIPAANNTWTRSASFRQAIFHDSGESGIMAYCSFECLGGIANAVGVSGVQHRTQGDNKLYAAALSAVGNSNVNNGNSTVANGEVWSSVGHFGIDYITPGTR